MIVCSTHDVEATRHLGHALATVLEPRVVVELVGGLGVGKTAMAQGIARGLGVEGRVTSPTFTMVATHSTSGSRGIATMLHADLYRVGSGVEADDLAIAELVEEAAVAVVEWSDVAPDVLGPRRLVIEISMGPNDNDRSIVIDPGTSGISEDLIGAVLDTWRDR